METEEVKSMQFPSITEYGPSGFGENTSLRTLRERECEERPGLSPLLVSTFTTHGFIQNY